jgi:hypothetical protein
MKTILACAALAALTSTAIAQDSTGDAVLYLTRPAVYAPNGTQISGPTCITESAAGEYRAVACDGFRSGGVKPYLFLPSHDPILQDTLNNRAGGLPLFGQGQ